jgi:hypothetical protein
MAYKSLYAGLRRKQEELTQVRREIESLNVAISAARRW